MVVFPLYLLGGVQSFGIAYTGDIDSLDKTSICRVRGSVASGTIPPTYSDWFCLITFVVDKLCGIQIATRATDQGAYIRFRWDSVWGNTWYFISLT